MDSVEYTYRRLPIVRQAGLSLCRMDGDGERFAAIFAETWLKLPRRARRRLLAYFREWRGVIIRSEPSPGKARRSISPEIQLVAGENSDFTSGNSGDAIANVRPDPPRLKFLAEMMDSMPPEHVACVIAHELAHVYLYTIHGKQHAIDCTPEVVGCSYETIGEWYVEGIVDSWGFDMVAHSRWRGENLPD